VKKLSHGATSEGHEIFLAPPAPAPLSLPAMLEPETSNLLQRMFRDPSLLDAPERKDLIAQLKSAVELAPQVAEVRVLFGMALCVDLQVHPAMEQMREAVNLAPDNFIAQLKFGELLMRLRICDQAAEHTHQAARLASNSVQSEMARRQAATIRGMQQSGIERGGYAGLLPRLLPFRRKAANQETSPVLVGSK
jgi:tetratricopeptide (TPR) repeat protein